MNHMIEMEGPPGCANIPTGVHAYFALAPEVVAEEMIVHGSRRYELACAPQRHRRPDGLIPALFQARDDVESDDCVVLGDQNTLLHRARNAQGTV